MIQIEKHTFGKVISNSIEEFEETNDLKLPEDYKSFLREYNGGHPLNNQCLTTQSDVQWIYGFHNGPNWSNIFWAIEIYQNRIPSWYMPFACDSGGNLYLISLYQDNFGLIAFWDHETETDKSADQYFDNLTFAANSFTEFIQALTSD